MDRIDIREFRDLGFLQEVNRQFFHPLGLALEVIVNTETGEEKLGGLWDARDDPEGFLFTEEDLSAPAFLKKARNVQQVWDEKARVRQERYGCVIQSVPQQPGEVF